MLIIIYLVSWKEVLWIKKYCNSGNTLLAFKVLQVKQTMNNQRLVISLTTTPSRIEGINKVLESLLNQSVKPNKVYLCFPYFSIRENIGYPIFPSFNERNYNFAGSGLWTYHKVTFYWKD